MAIELVPNEHVNTAGEDVLSYYVEIDGARVFEHTVAMFDPFDSALSTEIAQQKVLTAYLEDIFAHSPG